METVRRMVVAATLLVATGCAGLETDRELDADAGLAQLDGPEVGAALAALSYLKTYDELGLAISTRTSTDWCSGDCDEGHDTTWRTVAESNSWSGEKTLDHPECCKEYCGPGTCFQSLCTAFAGCCCGFSSTGGCGCVVPYGFTSCQSSNMCGLGAYSYSYSKPPTIVNTKNFSPTATSVSWDFRTFKVFEDGGSEGCGDDEANLSDAAVVVPRSSLTCDGIPHIYRARYDSASCGTARLRRYYQCQ